MKRRTVLYVCKYTNVEKYSNFSFAIVCAVQGKVAANSGSSDRLLLRHIEAQTTYRCLLRAEGLQSVSVTVTRGAVTVVPTQPDTAYTITCLGYDNQGRDLCREQSMSIITRECR